MTHVVNRVQTIAGEYVYICGWTTNGIDFSAVGCVHEGPKEAAIHANELAGQEGVLAIVGTDDDDSDVRDAGRTVRGRRGRPDRT